MKKYSLSNIMKRAWEIKKIQKGLSFSECLKKSWAKEKELTAYQEERNEMNEIDIATDAYERKTLLGEQRKKICRAQSRILGSSNKTVCSWLYRFIK